VAKGVQNGDDKPKGNSNNKNSNSSRNNNASSNNTVGITTIGITIRLIITCFIVAQKYFALMHAACLLGKKRQTDRQRKAMAPSSVFCSH
jgi:hypothetical protein